jgi:hypothetical protein
MVGKFGNVCDENRTHLEQKSGNVSGYLRNFEELLSWKNLNNNKHFGNMWEMVGQKDCNGKAKPNVEMGQQDN